MSFPAGITPLHVSRAGLEFPQAREIQSPGIRSQPPLFFLARSLSLFRRRVYRCGCCFSPGRFINWKTSFWVGLYFKVWKKIVLRSMNERRESKWRESDFFFRLCRSWNIRLVFVTDGRPCNCYRNLFFVKYSEQKWKSSTLSAKLSRKKKPSDKITIPPLTIFN